MKNGSLFLIPTYLSSDNDASFIAPMVKEVIQKMDYFLVENVRTARRFISSLNLGLDISSLHFEVLNKKTSASEIQKLLDPLNSGVDMGVISEAGLPGLADPGSIAVAEAHKQQWKVIPLPGASAIQTAVISSGFSGQQFTFHGYLPIDKGLRSSMIRQMEKTLQKTSYTQVFMETPFRNMALLQDLIKHLHKDTFLNVSSDIFGGQEMIRTQRISWWAKSKFDLHKIPAVFSLGQP